MTSRDTSEAALRVQRRVLAAMSPGQRIQLVARMSEDARSIAMAGIRARHPEWSDARVRRELLIRIYGADLIERAYGAGDGS